MLRDKRKMLIPTARWTCIYMGGARGLAIAGRVMGGLRALEERSERPRRPGAAEPPSA